MHTILSLWPICVAHVGRRCDGRNKLPINFDVFTCVQLPTSNLNVIKWFLEYLLSLCMCASLAPERLDIFYSCFIYKSLSIISLCPVSMECFIKI
jgi:hypothetical protein